MTDSDVGASHATRLDGSSRTVMVAVLAVIAALCLALAACLLFIASDGYRWWRAPFPTTIPRNLPVAVTSARPIGGYAAWFGADDYPAAAIRAGQEGRVRVAVLVGVDGRVEACEILAGSGVATLDRATCRAAVRHGAFAPARDANGRAMASRIDLPRVRWVLPSDER